MPTHNLSIKNRRVKLCLIGPSQTTQFLGRTWIGSTLTDCSGLGRVNQRRRRRSLRESEPGSCVLGAVRCQIVDRQRHVTLSSRARFAVIWRHASERTLRRPFSAATGSGSVLVGRHNGMSYARSAALSETPITPARTMRGVLVAIASAEKLRPAPLWPRPDRQPARHPGRPSAPTSSARYPPPRRSPPRRRRVRGGEQGTRIGVLPDYCAGSAPVRRPWGAGTVFRGVAGHDVVLPTDRPQLMGAWPDATAGWYGHLLMRVECCACARLSARTCSAGDGAAISAVRRPRRRAARHRSWPGAEPRRAALSR